MAKYYVQSGNLRLVLASANAQDAAFRAVRWSRERQAEVFREPAGDRIRDVEVLPWQIGRQVVVSESGFSRFDGDVFDTASLLLAEHDKRAELAIAGRLADGDRDADGPAVVGGLDNWRTEEIQRVHYSEPIA
jgi:hypothetical protein